MFEKTKSEVKSIYQTTKQDLKKKYNSENIHVIYGVARELLNEKIKQDVRGRLEDLRPCDLLDIIGIAGCEEQESAYLKAEAKLVNPKEEKKSKIRKRVGRAKTKRVKKQK